MNSGMQEVLGCFGSQHCRGKDIDRTEHMEKMNWGVFTAETPRGLEGSRGLAWGKGTGPACPQGQPAMGCGLLQQGAAS